MASVVELVEWTTLAVNALTTDELFEDSLITPGILYTITPGILYKIKPGTLYKRLL